INSAVLIAAILLAELSEPAPADEGRPPGRRRRVLITGGVATVATAALFIPSFLEAGGLQFAENDFRTAGAVVHLGRSAVKNLMMLGVPASIVVIIAVPAVVSVLRLRPLPWLIRFSVPAFVLGQILFLRFPWKMSHLLPCLVAGIVLLAVALPIRKQ